MRANCTAHAVELAKSGSGPISKLVNSCIEVGIIVPSIITVALKKAGYKVTYHSGPGEDAKEGDHEVGAWVLIKKGDVVVARAYSHDKPDALLQAVYAWLKEEAGVVLEGIAKV